ncbi:hypothetical protein SAMD00019534_121150 [Acytostelium subglobosum LB1]|uniref:hypothetical protein n=1 Tax=Acytostelium subglobosum LB1 TaxID=1410327 RepID=UPI000644C3A2|nr:hypothetical protein SAMD00019534_121150 [Acytostelium subglobosum LB1]GAM28939.1 hypothetical protein SAMD00019534_121150 [Acytostelium subglobosum LB1]|eukprot:XP_012748124.1 hypothetical protein SAMD00019534_121150 [Acytostelium subglobosum LB1]
MIKTSLLLMLVVASVALASASSHLMEGAFYHDDVPSGWSRTGRAVSDHDITLTFALRLSNIDKLEELLLQHISNPSSSSYRKYLTRQEVDNLVAPSQKDVTALKKWIEEELQGTIVKELPDYIVVSANAAIASAKLDTKFEQFEHPQTSKTVIRTLGPYSVPYKLASIVHFIGGTVRFPNRRVKSINANENVAVAASGCNNPVIPRLYAGDESFTFIMLPKTQSGGVWTDPSQVQMMGVAISSAQYSTPYSTILEPSQLTCESCSQITNSAIQQICQRTNQQNSLPANTVYCVSEEITSSDFQNYRPYNLSFVINYSTGSSSAATYDQFYMGQYTTVQAIQERYNMPMIEGAFPEGQYSSSPVQQAVAEFLDQYYNGTDLEQFFEIMGLDPRLAARVFVNGPNNVTNPGAEASLDIQYLMGLAPGFNTTFYSVGGTVNGQEPFLEWITDVLNDNNIIHVHSVSYGDDENTLSLDFMNRINQDFIKAGAVGITIMFSSGDLGVNSGNGTIVDEFVPSFPASSPYVLAVGATQFSTQTSPVCSIKPVGIISAKCNQVGEIASSIATGSRITSGGGFSNVFGRPSYQDAVVQDYINTHLENNIPSSYYNQSGRAYPDVSALGHNFIIVLAGEVVTVDGTSAAAPTFSSVITLLNDRLMSRGKAPLGFFNPTLYQLATSHSDAFFDIVMGDNSCGESLCNQYGFPAVPGWDAVTGFGSPNFESLSYAVDIEQSQ